MMKEELRWALIESGLETITRMEEKLGRALALLEGDATKETQQAKVKAMPLKNKKGEAEAAIMKIMADGVARHTNEIWRLTNPLLSVSMTENSFNNSIALAMRAGIVYRIRKGMYRAAPAQKEGEASDQ